MPRIVNHEDHNRRELNAMADEVGIDEPGNLKRFPNKASLAAAITERYAALGPETDEEAEALAAFEPVAYWAVGPAPVFPNPKLPHPALGRGNMIKPTRGRYVATTPFEQELIEKSLLKNGIVFREDDAEDYDPEDYCQMCNYRPRSRRAMARHFRACHPTVSS